MFRSRTARPSLPPSSYINAFCLPAAGGAAALVDFVRETSGNVRLPGIMALGYIAAFSEAMALAIIVGKGG